MPIVLHPDRVAAAPADKRLGQPALVVHLDGATDLLALHARHPDRYPVLLESGGPVSGVGRFDVLMAFPGDVLKLDSEWYLSGPAAAGRRAGAFLSGLDEWWSAEAGSSPPPQAVPFHGGWFVFLAYELARQIEPSLHLEAAADCPVAMAIRIPAAIIRDRHTGQFHAVAEAGRNDLLRQMQSDSRRSQSPSFRGCGQGRWPVVVPGTVEEDDPTAFLEAAERVKAHIAAGDVYQANISRRWQAQVTSRTRPWMLYERLRRANPAPFGGLASFDQMAILSSSPERLLRVKGGRIETRPIAGTRPRIAGAGRDDAHRAELLANPKERAEHVMLIDLERSDLGRVCLPGSVRVDEFMTIESYAHVHHIVSNVSGRLRPGTTPGDALRAIFPGGTITGCPKVRCISIIRALEKQPRGAYTGSMGYLNHDGSCDFNILIRSMTLQGDRLCLATGSGIVADSIPENEVAETRAKARGVLLSLEGPD